MTVPLAVLKLVIAGALGVAAAIVIVNVRLPIVLPPLAARTVTLYVPLAVGVPEIRPVLVLMFSPVGSPPAE